MSQRNKIIGIIVLGTIAILGLGDLLDRVRGDTADNTVYQQSAADTNVQIIDQTAEQQQVPVAPDGVMNAGVILASGRVEDIYLGMNIIDAIGTLPLAAVQKEQRNSIDGLSEIYRVYQNDQVVMEIEPRCGQEPGSCVVERIIVRDASATTRELVGVGSRFSDLETAYQIDYVLVENGHIDARVNALQATFRFIAPAQIVASELTLETIPSSLSVVEIRFEPVSGVTL